MAWTAESNLKGPKGDQGIAGGSVVYVSDTPPVDPIPNSLWYESDTGLLFVYYSDEDGGQWVSIPGVPADSVRYSAQTLSVEQKTQARTNIYAAPFDALAYNGMQVNGSMAVSQQWGTTSHAAPHNTITHIVDGWMAYIMNSTSALECLQGGLIREMPCSALSAAAATPFSAASDVALLYTYIEGYRVARLEWGAGSAQPITIGFWIYTNNLGGTLAVSVNNTGDPPGRGYVTDVTVTPGISQYKVVTIPGDVTGTWRKTNGVGMQVGFCLASGADNRGTPNVWDIYKLATPSTTNFFSAPNQVYITGVTILPGIEAPSAAQSPLIMRPYDQELLTCQRYFRKSYNPEDIPGAAAIYSGQMMHLLDGLPAVAHVGFFREIFSPSMRATPTIKLYSPVTGAVGKVRDNINGTDVTSTPQYPATSGFSWDALQSGPSTVFNFTGHYTADARL